MELEQIRSRLEHILEKRVTLEPNSLEAGAPPDGEVFQTGAGPLVVHGRITLAEHKLIALLLEQNRFEKGGLSENERQAVLLSSWILNRLEQGDFDAELPEAFARWPMLSGIKVPLLLYGDYPESQSAMSFEELRKLLKSFFAEEVVLVPLHNKQWLILADEALLAEAKEAEDDSQEDSLSALASGLQSMAANEWVGECDVAATYPFSPVNSLVQTVAALRDTIELGRTYRVSSNVHLPWDLRLETLLDATPRRAKLRFLEGVLRRAEPTLEPETLQTLEAFFAENCNVSDTAKMLYIHRNTLLYRLDKFKQETGMDVRSFDDAVLVRLALLLYKVTK